LATVAGTATTTNTAVSTDPVFADRSDIDVDSTGRPGVVWFSSVGVEFARWDPDSGTWHGMGSLVGPDLVDPGFGQPHIKFDSNDFPVIVWDAGASHVTRWNGSTYTNMAGAPGSDVLGTAGGVPQLELDASDNPHVAFVQDPAGPADFEVHFTKWMGSAVGWVGNATSDGNPATVDVDNLNMIFGNTYGSTPDVAITPDGRDAIAWVGTSGGVTNLFSTVWNGTDAYVRLDGTAGMNVVGGSITR
jgi:hypothetical protein